VREEAVQQPLVQTETLLQLQILLELVVDVVELPITTLKLLATQVALAVVVLVALEVVEPLNYHKEMLEELEQQLPLAVVAQEVLEVPLLEQHQEMVELVLQTQLQVHL
jgi:hypothetical protein